MGFIKKRQASAENRKAKRARLKEIEDKARIIEEKRIAREIAELEMQQEKLDKRSAIKKGQSKARGKSKGKSVAKSILKGAGKAAEKAAKKIGKAAIKESKKWDFSGDDKKKPKRKVKTQRKRRTSK